MMNRNELPPLNPQKNESFLIGGDSEVLLKKIEEEITDNPEIVKILAKNFFAYKILREIKKKDEITFQHVLNVTENVLVVIKNNPSFSDEMYNNIVLAAITHDTGKTDEKILEIVKKPDKLTNEEDAIIQTHSRKSFQRLKNIGMLDPAKIVVQHHEHGDEDVLLRRSYPRANGENEKIENDQRIKDPEVDMMARILSIADVFESLVAKRQYKGSFSLFKCSDILRKKFKKEEDQEVIDILLKSYKNKEDNINKNKEDESIRI